MPHRLCGVADSERSLVVKVTAGTEDKERANQGFTVAAAAVVAGVRTSLWLTGEASWFAIPGHAAKFDLAEAAPLGDLLGAVLADGRVTLCTQCAARREIGPEDVLEDVRIAGAATFVEEIMTPGAQALVY
jgi:predicted peroxiredoxin